MLSGTSSLFQQAVERVNTLGAHDIAIDDTLVVTQDAHRFLAMDQLRELQSIKATLLLEPVGRNTAPALTLAALQATQCGADPILVVVPADQTVNDQQAFITALQNSIRVAAQGSIVLLGITPDRPETGYGYIQRRGATGPFGEFQIVQFTEKPDADTARQYLSCDEYAWNSGLFVLKASVWLKALQRFRPDILDATREAWCNHTVDTPFVRPSSKAFAEVPSDSIDYAVMERCPDSEFPIRMVPLAAGWNDVGAWDAVWQMGTPDAHGNVTHGDTLLTETRDTLVHATHRLVGAVGVSNLVIVETADAILVAERNQSQEIKKLVAQLELLNREEKTLHRKVHRPWGWYDSIDVGERFKVKRILVKPQASLSLQKHHHRAEHWIVVKGTAMVTNGDQVITLCENQSVDIPMGQMHRLANPGDTPLEIIEVQSGSYLGEDDIVRFDDNYGLAEASPNS